MSKKNEVATAQISENQGVTNATEKTGATAKVVDGQRVKNFIFETCKQARLEKENVLLRTNNKEKVDYLFGKSLNYWLKGVYRLIGKKLETFEKWNADGFFVKKGEKAFMFWGCPVLQDDGKMFFPIKYLFSENQVVQRIVNN